LGREEKREKRKVGKESRTMRYMRFFLVIVGFWSKGKIKLKAR